jgi:hypothetical protein
MKAVSEQADELFAYEIFLIYSRHPCLNWGFYSKLNWLNALGLLFGHI